jgi:4-amino-4-deoxy-L-arabinose transferase-like glycosyltransferase
VRSLRQQLGLIFVLLLALALFAYGISWGLPSARGWAGDEILPQTVRQAVNKGFSGGWHTKYPPFQYVLLALVQTPLRWLRASHDTLMLAGRWLSVVMALGTVWLIYRTGREIYGRRSAVFAALTTALIPPFVYFGKTANVDGPFLLWVAASFLFYIRIFDRHRLRDYVLFAVCAMLAVGTKDQAYGLYVLSPLPILISLHRHRAREGASGWLGTLLDRRTLAAAGAGVLAFVLVFQIPWNLRGFLHHVGLLTGSQSEEAQFYPNTPSGHLQNLVQTAKHLQFCLGWPLFLAAIAGIVQTFRRSTGPRERSRLAALAVLGLSYYLTFLSVVLFSRDRYVLPLALILTLFAGRGLGDLAAPGRARPLRLAAVAAIVLYSVLYALSVDLRMVNDSRYAAERWLHDRRPLPKQAAAVGRLKHAPRIEAIDWPRVFRKDGRILQRQGLRYLVVNVTDLRSPEERAIYKQLLAGKFGYSLAGQFRWQSPWDLLDTRGSYTTLDLVNPRIAVFERGDR